MLGPLVRSRRLLRMPVQPGVGAAVGWEAIATTKTTTMRGGKVAVAIVSGPAGGRSCRVTAPKRLRITIAGKRHTVVVLAPQTLRPGAKARATTHR